jgi:hypothetical protein
MSKLRKLVLTGAALAALAVGGAAFAQAQNGSSPQGASHSSGSATRSDLDPGQSADTGGPDRSEGAAESPSPDGTEAGAAGEHEGGQGHDASSGHEAEDGN